MDLVAIIRIAMRALARNKLRSMLTMLGIIIGVGAVIAMVSVGQGAQQQAQQQIAAMGSNMLFVQSGTVNRGGMRMGWGATKTLVYDDMLAIMRECPSVVAAAPGSQASAQVVFGNDNWATNVNGTEPQYFDIRSWPFAEGTSFTQDDVSTAANVAVIGETVRKNLFGATDPIGETVRINNLPFKVVGLLTRKARRPPWVRIRTTSSWFPSPHCKRKLPGRTGCAGSWFPRSRRTPATPRSSRSQPYCATAIAFVPDRMTTFSCATWPTWPTWPTRTPACSPYLLASIASISLLVGGIGIMNIMLVSVTERTREIGIRMAIGATEGDVQQQFLIEAVVLSVVGGGIGILVRHGSLLPDHADSGMARAGFSHRNFRRRAVFDGGGNLLRLLSRPQGGPARSDRSPALRIADLRPRTSDFGQLSLRS